jgi:hypothetical protein
MGSVGIGRCLPAAAEDRVREDGGGLEMNGILLA